MREDWIEVTLEDMLDYIQPTNYIVNSTEYSDNNKIPVLTAGKSFILGYTNEEQNIFSDFPAIIFDDFTTATQYVNFKFKVKSSAMKILIPKVHFINLKYVFYYMQTIRFNTDTHKRYWISIYSKLKIPLAPLPEHHAIVVKIEELFSELDNGILNLHKAKEKLEIYRQAVLKKAFEGELTKEWRKNYAKNCGNKMLKSKKYENNKLPINWSLEKLSTVCEAIGGYAFKSNSFINDGGQYQIIRIGNIRPGKLRLNKSPAFINDVEENIITKYKLKYKDVLISLTGTRKKRDYGYTVLVNKSNLLLNQRVAALRFNEKCLPEYFLYFSWTDIFKDQFFESETGNVGQGNVGMNSVRDTNIYLPPIEEQKAIVSEVEARLSVYENTIINIDEALNRSEALRQSILKKAFEGKLLSKDELEACRREKDWEPADKLIEKIRKNRVRS